MAGSTIQAMFTVLYNVLLSLLCAFILYDYLYFPRNSEKDRAAAITYPIVVKSGRLKTTG